MKKLLLLILLLSIIPSVLAMSSIGEFQQNNNVELIQICANCTSVNITTIKFPNSSIANINVMMSENSSTYNYTFTRTDLIGDYFYTTCGNPDAIYTCESVSFEITTTGDKVSLSNIILVIVFLVLALMFLYLGSLFEKDKWMVKTAFFITSLLLGLLAVNTARIIASESLNLSRMGTTGIIIMATMISFMFMYILVIATINVIKQLKDKKAIRWNY